MLLSLKLKTKPDDKKFRLGNTPKRQVGDTSKSSERTASSSLTPVNLDSVTKNEDESADFKDALDYFQTGRYIAEWK